MINKEVVVFQIEDMLSNINKENLLSFGGHIDNGAAFLELMTNVLTLLKEQDNCENCAIAIEDRQLVVRCKDCKHAEHCEIYAGWDGQHLDWFCADGERDVTR